MLVIGSFQKVISILEIYLEDVLVFRNYIDICTLELCRVSQLGQGGVERADGVGYPFWNYTLEWHCRTLAALSARGFNSPGGSSLGEGETSWSF